MRNSETIGSLVAALAAAQLQTRNPLLDKAHPHFKGFRYASLGAHLDAIREPFARNGLVVAQGVTSEDLRVAVTTRIAHTSGEWMESTVSIALPEKATAQNLGAAVTYLRRYAIAAMCLLTGDDDTDAEENEDRGEKPAAKPAARAASNAAMFDPRPVAAPAAPVAAKPAAPRWPKSGIGAVRISRIVARDGGVNAVLCEHPEHGSSWVSVPVAWSVEDGRTVELTWGTAAGGHIEALEIRGVSEEVPF